MNKRKIKKTRSDRSSRCHKKKNSARNKRKNFLIKADRYIVAKCYPRYIHKPNNLHKIRRYKDDISTVCKKKKQT